MMRLDRFLANMRCGSRKDVKAYISNGLVYVGGVCVKNSGAIIDEYNDNVTLKGTAINYRKYVYIMMNKPAGVLSATEDKRGDTTCIDILSEQYKMLRLSVAGRLDKDTEGFLLLSNDGDFIHSIISPCKHIKKKYYAECECSFSDSDINAFAEGCVIDGKYKCMSALLEICDGNDRCCYVTIEEGKFHQVKKMMFTVNNSVKYLKRVSIGGLRLDENLRCGEYRELTDNEVESLFIGENNE